MVNKTSSRFQIRRAKSLGNIVKLIYSRRCSKICTHIRHVQQEYYCATRLRLASKLASLHGTPPKLQQNIVKPGAWRKRSTVYYTTRPESLFMTYVQAHDFSLFRSIMNTLRRKVQQNSCGHTQSNWETSGNMYTYNVQLAHWWYVSFSKDMTTLGWRGRSGWMQDWLLIFE